MRFEPTRFIEIEAPSPPADAQGAATIQAAPDKAASANSDCDGIEIKTHDRVWTTAMPPTGAHDDRSLGDGATFQGQARHSRPQHDVSLGADRTLGGDNTAETDTVIDDIEVVDLEARYKVEGSLGQGGMGAVLLATDTRLGRKIAIKRILGEAARSKTAITRFLTEAKAIAALNHPNIVQIYDYGRAKDGPFLIMEYIDGGSLADLCKAGAVAADKAIDLVCQVCDGLGIAHEQGIIHRDIKPANILLNKAGVPKLTDFGLAKAESADHGMTMTGAVMGTPDFMPPEQRRDATLVDSRSDLWSLAATFYQMLTGRSPKIVRLHEVPQSMQAVLAKALEDEKADRYQSAAEFREAVRQAFRQPAPRAAFQALDLPVGECPKCRQPNEASRKFCCNGDCGAPLRVRCLSAECGHEIPVWDKVCPECGAKQPELVAARVTTLAAEREAAQRSLANCDFDAALGVAEALGQITDTRLGDFGEWGRTFAGRIAQEKAAAGELRKTLMAEAKAHRKAFDYPAAIHALESLPERLCTGRIAKLLASLRAESAESTNLMETIRGRIAARDLDGLLAMATRALELQGNHDDLRTLVDQLRKREEKLEAIAKEALVAAQSLFAGGDARGALEKVASITIKLPPQGIAFKEELGKAVAEEDTLLRLLASVKADGVVTPEEVALLATQVSRCLKANPAQPKIEALRLQLVERIQKRPDEFVPHVKRLVPFIQHFRGQVPSSLKELLKAEAAASGLSGALGTLKAAMQCPRCGKMVGGGMEYVDHVAACIR